MPQSRLCLLLRGLTSCVFAVFMASCTGGLSKAVAPANNTLLITPTSLPPGVVGAAYSSELSGSGGTLPYTWVVGSGNLPQGLSLASNGIISGTPTTTGQYSLTAKVTDSSSPAQSTSASVSISISSGSSTLSITTTTLPSGLLGKAYSSGLSATGGMLPYNWVVTSGNLPKGLTLASNGIISGTPTGSGQYGFTASVKDSGSPAHSASITASGH
jgi:hypothetical protein